jgi:hypothetical protein
MHRSRLLALLLALALGVLFAPAAHAEQPVEQDHYDDVFDIIVPTPDDPPGETFCGLTGVPIHGELHGYFSLQVRGSSDFLYFGDRFRAHFVYTNPLTGKTFTVDTIGAALDVRIVDNGDGTLTITNIFVGVQKVYDGAGNLLFMDRGQIREVFLVETMGTVDPEDDVFIEDLALSVRGPHDTFDNDFCEDFLTYTA